MLAAVVPGRAATDSADLTHTHVQLMAATTGVAAPGTLRAGLYFKLEPGWHVYWMNPGDAGEPPQIHWALPNGVTAGALEFPAPKRLPLGPLMDFGYEGEVLFPFALQVDASAASGVMVRLPAKVTWLVCREQCIPEKANLELDVPVVSGTPAANSAATALFQRFTAALPSPLPKTVKAGFTVTPDSLRLTVETGKRESAATFFPADANQLSNPAPEKITPTAKGLVLELKKDASLTAAPTQLRGVIELSGGRSYEFAALAGEPRPGTGLALEPAAPAAAALPQQQAAVPAGAAKTPPLGLLRAAVLAFLGGLVLNLMPCVFPVLFIKGLALVRSSTEERHTVRIHGLVYTAGILVSFWILVGALLGLRAAGSVLGWGFQFQSPVFLSLMAALLFFLGLSLAGQFEIGLSFTSAGGSLAAKQGFAGSFFTGVLAVVVATPCTAPLMGAAVGYALAQSAAVTFAIFTMLALGLAAPYVALTLQPAWTRVLPKPGAWMDILKQATAVPIFATVIWLAWVLAQAYGASVLAALLAALLLLAIAGWFLGRWPAKRWATAIAVLLVAGVIAISVAAPGKLAAAPQQAGASASQGGWENWSADAVSRYRAQGRPVFVDFTASWCLSCQVNERVALSQPEVKKAFADAHVALLRADWTQHDDAITQTLTQLGRSGVPTYVFYAQGAAQPTVLPEVLTPGIVTDAIAAAKR
ncbi:MAG TPA: thioredoxin family protein [Terracidiphilus sp.]|nr:thioredoxin family protein [Terracidiphilus sp.]